MYKYNYTHEKIGFNSVMESWINIRKSNNAIHHINRVHKKKNGIIISMDTEKAFNKI